MNALGFGMSVMTARTTPIVVAIELPGRLAVRERLHALWLPRYYMKSRTL